MKDAASQRAERLKKVEGFVKEDYEREREILEKVDVLTTDVSEITERLQDDARWAFKDAHNYYVLHKKSIDPFSLEALESKYEHYRRKNGNTFVHDVMEQLRALPITPYDGDDNAK